MGELDLFTYRLDTDQLVFNIGLLEQRRKRRKCLADDGPVSTKKQRIEKESQVTQGSQRQVTNSSRDSPVQDCLPVFGTEAGTGGGG
ncbi:hypothetical protein CDAR_522651 [Caerostris darwini]|uniref:Uncharacterized protein n=1 Tax=Caerostris darwini TaxID=1538125 RepID=A0AAV4QWW9_9ARAC|nr:hypothetical protein CDAR_522651 [Caerostris darwini]